MEKKLNVMEDEREYMLNKTAHELSDEIWPIMDKLEKAIILIQEITEEYFDKYNREEEKSKRISDIVWEFPRYGIYAHMIDDYVFEAKKCVQKLQNREKTYVEVKSNKSA